MGNYRITIEGLGAHGNPDYPGDADVIAAEAVTKLRNAGHSLARAEFMQTAVIDGVLCEGSHIDLRNGTHHERPYAPPAAAS